MSSTPDSRLDDKPTQFFKEEASLDAVESQFDPAEERKIVSKIDRRLLVILGALYAISLIDRNNISIARVVGMAKDLQLTVGMRYSIITAIFFPTYILFELPSNIVLRKAGCRNWLSFIAVAWGAVMLGMGFVNNWHQLAACRVILGLLEAGFFPGCVFLISTWYTRFETQRRLALFYLFSMFLAGFSNIIGYGFSRLGGAHGIAAWRWVFILFGAITMGLGLIAYFLIVDFPDKNNFLTPEETKFVIDRINIDRGDAEPDALTPSKFFKHCGDFKLWVFGLCFCFTTMPAYAFSYFLPVILAGGGYSVVMSLCLSAPPYAFAAIYTYISALVADKYHMRAPVIIANCLVCTIGLFIMGFTKQLGVRYFGSFLAIAGCQANVPAVLAYQANNILRHSKRAVSSAIVIGMGGVGGIFASFVYRQKDFPKYLPGIGATVGCQGAIILMCIGMSFYFRAKNKKADQGVAIENMPKFRYTI
ncbi:hypothetical protein OIV83_005910 [Microbotryomycetes sp. JL201]|nr:hypothetical protein OIV83_005910 [Microbotryomycetes sp. JL201]